MLISSVGSLIIFFFSFVVLNAITSDIGPTRPRYIVTIIFAFISSSLFAQNQEVVQSQALQQQDTVTVAQPMAPLADSSLVGTSIF